MAKANSPTRDLRYPGSFTPALTGRMLPAGVRKPQAASRK